jgi:Centromere DNA-binding protein complex CBF3 subunit, domain 2
VWPQIDGWLRQFDEGINEPDLAGQGFLKLLKRPRTIYLQDSVLLRRRFPKHALFATPEYAYDGVEPHLTHIERADPLVTSELQTLGRTVASAETELRLEAAGIALPAIAGPDLGQQRTGILPEPLSETVEPAELPVYKMVRTHAAVTDLW